MPDSNAGMSDANEKLKLENERLKLWLSFIKALIISGIVVVVLALLNNSVKEKEIANVEREIEDKEMKIFGDYIKYALTEKVGARKRFSQYFATVTRSEKQRKQWAEYDRITTIEFLKEKHDIDSLSKVNNVIEAKKIEEKEKIETRKNLKIAKAKNSTVKNRLINEAEKEKTDIDRQYKEQLESIQNAIAEVKSNLKVVPISAITGIGSGDVNPKPVEYKLEIQDNDRYTGEGYQLAFKNNNKETIVEVHVTDINRGMDEASMYLSSENNSNITAGFIVRNNEETVQYLEDKLYKITIKILRFGRRGNVRCVYYDMKVEKRI